MSFVYEIVNQQYSESTEYAILVKTRSKSKEQALAKQNQIKSSLILEKLIKEKIKYNTHSIDYLGSNSKTCDSDQRLNLINDNKLLESLLNKSLELDS